MAKLVLSMVLVVMLVFAILTQSMAAPDGVEVDQGYDEPMMVHSLPAKASGEHQEDDGPITASGDSSLLGSLGGLGESSGARGLLEEAPLLGGLLASLANLNQ